MEVHQDELVQKLQPYIKQPMSQSAGQIGSLHAPHWLEQTRVNDLILHHPTSFPLSYYILYSSYILLLNLIHADTGGS